MAAYIPVPRDLTRVKTKVFFNLTKRQLLCFGAAALIGVPIFFLVKATAVSYTHLNNTLAFLSLYLRQYAPEQLAVVYELILLVVLPLAALFLVCLLYTSRCV